MSAYIKNVYRTIFNNYRRYAVMVLITALGVAFFVGLRSTSPDMNYTLDTYFDEQGMYDLRLLTSLGLTEEQIASIAATEGVKNVVPAYYCDMFATIGSDSSLARVHSLDVAHEGGLINMPKLIEGRIPEKADECLIEERHLAIVGGRIGDAVTLSTGDDEDIADTLKRSQFTIVGSIASPVYISPTLDSTKKGSGRLETYLYIPAENFDSDIYTEAYVQLQNSNRYSRFSDQYEQLLTPVEDTLEASGEGMAEERYADIQKEGAEKIADGKQEISDARQKIADAEQELGDANVKIADGEQELTDKTAEFYEKIADGEEELRDGRQKLDDAQREVQDAKQELADGKKELEDGKADLLELKKGLREIAQNLAVYAFAEIPAAMADSLQELYDGEAELDAAKSALDDAEKLLAKSKKELADGEAQLLANAGQLAAARQTLAGFKSDLTALQAGKADMIAQYGDPSGYVDPLLGIWNGLLTNEAQLAGGIALIEQQLAAADAAAAQIEAGKAQLPDAEQQIKDGRAEWKQGNAKLQREKEKLVELCEELEIAGLDELPQGLQDLIDKIPEAEKEIADGEKKIRDGEQELLDAEKTLAEKELEYEDGVRELEDGRQEGLEGIAEGRQKIADAKIELADGQAKFDDAKKEADEKLPDAERDIADAEKKLRELDTPKAYVLGLDSNIGFASFKQDSERINSISKYFPFIFFLVATLVSFTSMVRVVEFDRPTIGALKSLGYGPWSIIRKYIFYAFAVCVPGCAIGIGVGYKLFPYIIFNKGYKIMYLMPSILTPLQPTFCAIAFGIALVSVLAPTIAVCGAELFDVPAVLLRPKAPRGGKRILLERVQFIWRRMSFSAKVTARNILRYKKRFLMTVTGVIGCTAIVLTGFGLKDSIGAISAKQFGEVFVYDFEITLKDAPKQDDLQALTALLAAQPDVGEWIYNYKVSFDTESTNGVQSVMLRVSPDAEALSRFVNLRDPKTGALQRAGGDGAVITEKLARLAGLSAGDEIKITDADGNAFTVPIAGVAENYVSHYLYLTAAQYEQIFGSAPEYNEILGHAPGFDAARRDSLSAQVLKNDAVNGMSYLFKVKEFYVDMVNSLNVVVLVLLVAGALLSFIVLFSLTSINIDERQRELATLKVLGFFDRETASYIFRENVVSTAIGTGFGLIAGIFLHRLVMGTAEVDMVMFGRAIYPLSYVFTAVLSFAFLGIVNWVMSFSIKKIDMIESLKSVE